MNIRILGVDYAIMEPDIICRDERVLGQISFDRQTIELESGLAEGQKSVVLLHEILHGLRYQMGFHAQNDDEVETQALASGLYQVLRDNPELLALLGLRQGAASN